MYVGVCMSVCSWVCLGIAYAYVNLNFWPTRFVWYRTFYIGYSDPALFYILYKVNHTLRLLFQNKKPGQSAHASAVCSVSPIAVTILTTWEILTRLHSLAQPAQHSWNKPGNLLCRIELACAAIYSLSVYYLDIGQSFFWNLNRRTYKQ